MAGGPSQIETFDDKPVLRTRNGEQLPDSVRQGQRLTGMSGNQSSLPLAGSQFRFSQHGRNGTWVSDLLPHTAKVVDELCIVRSMYTDAINHDPAITFLQTGSQIAGRPSIGAWVHYGLGSDTADLPAFVVLITPGKVDQPLYSRLWASGFLPSQHQGVQLRGGKDAVLYLTNPAGVTPHSRRLLLDRLRDLHVHAAEQLGDGDVDARIAQYEMAYRHAGQCAWRDGPVLGERRDLRAVRPGREDPRQLRGQLPAGPAPRRTRCASSSSCITRAGISTTACRRASSGSAARPTRPARPWSPTSSGAGCSTTPSSSGAGSSGGPATHRAS